MRYLKFIVNYRVLFVLSHMASWIILPVLQAHDEKSTAFLTILAHSNHLLPMETAGSHGIDGFKIGAGLNSFSVNKEAQRITQAYLPLNSQNSFLSRNNISVLKGLGYPWDIGFNLSRSMDHKLLQTSAFIQRTLYEDFLMPAVAARSGVSYIHRESAEIISLVGSLVVSWGLGPLSLYGEYSLAWHDAQLLSPEISQEAYNSHLFTSAKTLGLQCSVILPLLGLAAEVSYKTKDMASYGFKLTLGM